MADDTPPRTTLPELRIGDLVGRYKVTEFLGEGGMALVYAVTHLDGEHVAALKVPKADLDPELRENFLSEARAHLALNGNPYVVAPMETGTLPSPDGRPYLVMQKVKGDTLERVFAQNPPIADDPARELRRLARGVRMLIQVAMGLAEAHRQDDGRPPIVHRDLKPANVLVVDKAHREVEGVDVPRVLISDFGLAWRRGEVLRAAGSPQYVSPEQALNEGVGPRSDLYSFGIMLFELIEGRVPFDADDVMTVLVMHRNEPPPPLSNPVGARFQALVSQLLEKRPERRPRSATEVANRLSNLLAGLEQNLEPTWVGKAPVRPDSGELPGQSAATAKLPTLPDVPIEPRVETHVETVKSLAGMITRPRGFLAAALLVVLLAIVASRVVGSGPVEQPVPPAPPPAPALPVAPVAEVPPPPVPIEPDDLAPVSPTPKPVAVAKPPPTVKPSCTPDDAWRRRVRGDLEEIEADGKNLSAVERNRAIEPIFNAAMAARTPADCARIDRQILELAKRALP